MQRLLAEAQKISGVKYDISNFSDIIEAIHVIQTEMGITGTTAKEAASTIEGSMNMTKSAWTNLLTGMADDNADFDVLVQNLVNSLGSLAENLLPRIKIAIKGIGELFRTLLPKVLDELPDMLASLFPESMQENVRTILNGIIEEIKNMVNVAMEWLPKIAEGFAWILDNSEFIAAGIISIGVAIGTLKIINTVSKIGGIFKNLFMEIATGTPIMEAFNIVLGMNPFVLIAAAVVGLVAGFIYLWNTSEGFRNFFINMWESIKTFFIESWNAIMGFFTETIPSWIESMKQWFSDLGTWFGELWAGIKQWFVDGWNSIVTFFTESIPMWWEGVKQAFADGWNAVVAFFTETIPAWLESMFNWFCELPDKIAYGLGYAAVAIKNWVVDAIETFIQCCENIIYNVTEWFMKLPGVIWEWLVNAYNNIVQWASDTWNKFVETCTNVYNSVTEWFAKLPGMIWDWLSQAIDKAVQWGQETYWNMVQAVSDAVNAVIEWFAKLPGKIWDWLVNTVNKVIDWGANLAKSGAEAGGKLVTGIIDIVKDLPSKFMEIGVNIVKGIWEGIKSVGSWLHDRVSGFFENMLQGARDANKICSPSKLYRDEVGKYMAQGVGVGFEDEADNVQKSIEKDFNRMAGRMQLAVDYNMADTTAGIVARNNRYSAAMGTDCTGTSVENKTIIEVPINFEGREMARVIAPYQDEFAQYDKGR